MVSAPILGLLVVGGLWRMGVLARGRKLDALMALSALSLRILRLVKRLQAVGAAVLGVICQH